MTDRFSPAWRNSASARVAGFVEGSSLPGALALLWADGELVLATAAGERAPGVPMEMDAIFQIASMTKPIVSVAALQLVDEGILGLDDPIEAWIPELASPRVLEDPTGPLSRSRAASRPITVQHLLTHRAGFGYAFLDEGPIATAYDRAVGSVLSTTYDVDEWLGALAGLPLLDEPGTRFRYGHSTDVLGCLLARVDGVTLGESLRRRVLGPLGMTDTDFAVPDDKRHRLARIVQQTPESRVDVTAAPAVPPRFEAAGGGLYSTGPDYLRFARLILGGGRLDDTRLLQPRTAALMLQNHLPADVRALPAIGRADFFEHSGFGYGVGVVLDAIGPESPRPGAVNWKGIFGTWWRADADAGIAAVLMTQEAADITSASGPRNTTVPTAAGLLQEEFEAMIYRTVNEGWGKSA
ncbi:serine hydrolase domain-containing protein [soil metagenome]